MNFDRTENFFRMFHLGSPGNGSIILERKFGAKTEQSQISTIDLEKNSKHACGIEEIYFSTATFLGRPLLLNFASSNCIHLQIPKREWNTEILVKMRLENKGIPLPTAITFDGEKYTFFWILDRPIENHEFYLYALLQKNLYNAAIEFNPTKNNLDTAFLTRIVGSINGKNKEYTRLITSYGKTYSKKFLEDAILNSGNISAAEYRNLQIQAGITLELMSLLGERWFSTYQNPETFDDWIIFFGSSLCKFCTPNQLTRELYAIAETLEAKSWGKISHRYKELIADIAATAKDGYIKSNGIYLSINDPHWIDLIIGKLSITEEEMHNLNLQVLGNKSCVSPHLHIQPRSIHPIGHMNFVPVERLLLRA